MEIAKRWYECTELDERVYRLREPHVHPFARCNIWLIRGSARDLLIDAGTGLGPLAPALPPSAGRPLIVAATHIHFDHVGALHEFPDRRAHASRADAYATMPDSLTLAHLFRALDEPVAKLPCGGWHPEHYAVRPATVGVPMADGDRIDLGDRTLTVLHLPGHSDDSIALFEERTGILFSGDALYDGELIDSFPSSNVELYRATMERLRALQIRIGHGGHGPSFDNSRKLVLIEDYLRGKRTQACPGGV
jgi:glyoxylase-like metal-dependent hydrolase (beta-lactamase superfamily II)